MSLADIALARESVYSERIALYRARRWRKKRRREAWRQPELLAKYRAAEPLRLPPRPLARRLANDLAAAVRSAPTTRRGAELLLDLLAPQPVASERAPSAPPEAPRIR